jgi:hypothetical protein
LDSLQRNYKLLGYAGLCVFIVLALAVVFGAPNIGPSPTQLFLYYSVSILCFLSGSLWAQTVSGNAFGPAQLFISNTLTLLACASLTINSPTFALAVLACAFSYLYYCEWHSANPSRLGKSYQSMRFKLTTVVVLCHFVVLSHQ